MWTSHFSSDIQRDREKNTGLCRGCRLVRTGRRRTSSLRCMCCSNRTASNRPSNCNTTAQVIKQLDLFTVTWCTVVLAQWWRQVRKPTAISRQWPPQIRNPIPLKNQNAYSWLRSDKSSSLSDYQRPAHKEATNAISAVVVNSLFPF
jgi:hypothetical protein